LDEELENDMVKNDFDIDVKVKCLEERITQAQLAEMIGTSAPYISRLINNKNDIIVNKTFVEMLEALGYDIQLTYIKREK
jgi:predicted XRE-type DNA-binding protein